MNRKKVISGIFKLQANLNHELKKVLRYPQYTKLQIRVLLELDNQNEWVSLKDISSNLVVSQTSITRVVERMQKQRLIHFKVPSTDRRKILIKASPAGNQLLKFFYEEVNLFLKKIDKGLNKSEKKIFQVIFEKINLTDFFSDLE
ncbi:hypothetical protein CL659_03655 [bacterium]|nr:hypothetical protein [bacterium]|tara:strand:+ start:255 stop:689 length:435 start_codon:yes stop_codon:yes gene_type:complete